MLRGYRYGTVEGGQEVGGYGTGYKDDVVQMTRSGQALYAQGGRERSVALNPRQAAENRSKNMQKCI